MNHFMYFIVYRYQKGFHVSLGKFTKERYVFSNLLDLQGKKHMIHIDRCEYEINHGQYPTVFRDPWIPSLRCGISEVSDKGKFGSNFIKIISVI